MNLSRHTTITAVLSAFKHLFPEVPINGGCFRPFDFVFPDDCFLDTRRPHAVGGYVEGAIRVMESVFGALAAVLPEQATAASFGTGGTLTLAGQDLEGEYFATVFPMCGGYGGSRDSDGIMHGPIDVLPDNVIAVQVGDLVGDGDRRSFTQAQMRRLADLVEVLTRDLGIPGDRVLLHSDVAPVSDPGRLFHAAEFRRDLKRLRPGL